MPHILIAESLHEPTLHKIIASEGAILSTHAPSATDRNPAQIIFSYQPHITPEQLENVIGEYDALIVRPKPVTAKAIAKGAAGRCKLIVRGGAGVNSIAVEEAKKHQIIVENTPGLNSAATAEFTFQLLMMLLAKRPILASVQEVMNAANEQDPSVLDALQPDAYTGHELRHKTLAIIGLGHIGTRVARMALGFDMRVIAYSRRFNPQQIDPTVLELGITQANSIQDAIKQADAVSLHCPLTEDSHHMANSTFFQALKPRTVLINTARPALIDQEACAYAMQNGIVGGLAIDGDPADIRPFTSLANAHRHIPCYLTHHIADNTEEAQSDITQQALSQVFAFLRTQESINWINPW